MRIHWPDLTLPPINLWNAPLLSVHRAVAVPIRRHRRHRAKDVQASIRRLCPHR
jgi:hypothetical protein